MSLDQAAARQPNPGRVPLHRLNRTEYANAIVDLLGLRIDASELLPKDDEADGFDNVASVLTVSPSFLDQYISAARVVSQSVAYEIPMLLVVITVLMMTGTLDLNEIIRQQGGALWHWNFFKVWVNPLMPVTFVKMMKKNSHWRPSTIP